MIEIDQLFSLSNTLLKDSYRVESLRTYLEAIYDSASYQEWLEDDQYLGFRSIKGKPKEPPEAEIAAPGGKRLIADHRLSSGGRLTVKVDRHKDRIHLTDGFFTPPTVRVFPTCDESEIVCKYIENNLEIEENGMLIDPACGCGHHALGLRSLFSRRVSLDISGRAIAFARLNAILNSDTRHSLGFGDVRIGIPIEIANPGGQVVFAINMPFAIDPKNSDDKSGPIFLAQDGGDRGVQLTFSALDSIRDFKDRNPSSPVDAVVLCYSLGYKDSQNIWHWEVEEHAKKVFENGCVEFVLQETEKLWRVNGIKSEPNPMPVERLELKADCKNTYSDHVREVKREGYPGQSHE